MINAPDSERPYEPRIRILVVDDHEMFAQSLVRLLGAHSSIEVVGSALTAAQAEKAAVLYAPDVILMDFELPDRDGAKAAEAIRVLMPEVKIVMLTGHADQRSVMRAIGAGCVGFVPKSDPVDKLIDAIHSAHVGHAPAAISKLLYVSAPLRTTSRSLGSDLSRREVEVVQLMAEGLSNKALAQKLHISLNTVRNHVQKLLYKLGAHSKLEAVATAIRDGIIEREEPGAHR